MPIVFTHHAHLLAECDLVAAIDHFGSAGLGAVLGYCRYGHALACGYGVVCHRYLTNLGHDLGIVVNGLAKVAQRGK